MSVTINPKTDITVNSTVGPGGIQKLLETTGRLPPISMVITPLDKSPAVYLDRFLTYKFNASILIPCDTFDFSFAAPDDVPFYNRVKEGDIVSLYANNLPLATGLIDTISPEIDNEFGEKIHITGRDLASQLEEQDAISFTQDPIWATQATIDQVASALFSHTRINGLIKQDTPAGSYLFATEPAETKIAALQRFLEPLNCIFWMMPNGAMKIGRPNMAQKPISTLIMSKTKRQSNVLNMKAIFSSTTIPNVIVPIWNGQETVVSRVSKEQVMYNTATGPARLRNLGNVVARSVMVSTPQGADPQSLSGVNALVVGGSNILQAYAKRELARRNQQELIVQATVPGYYNENGDPYQVDQVYKIEFDRGPVDESMYLFQIDYELSEEGGQKTNLYFCRKGTIVSDVRAR